MLATESHLHFSASVCFRRRRPSKLSAFAGRRLCLVAQLRGGGLLPNSFQSANERHTRRNLVPARHCRPGPLTARRNEHRWGGVKNSRHHATHSMHRLIKHQSSNSITDESPTPPNPQSKIPSPISDPSHHTATSRHSAAPAHRIRSTC